MTARKREENHLTLRRWRADLVEIFQAIRMLKAGRLPHPDAMEIRGRVEQRVVIQLNKLIICVTCLYETTTYSDVFPPVIELLPCKGAFTKPLVVSVHLAPGSSSEGLRVPLVEGNDREEQHRCITAGCRSSFMQRILSSLSWGKGCHLCNKAYFGWARVWHYSFLLALPAPHWNWS